MVKEKNGHLIIHNVSFRVAEQVAEILQKSGYSINADWWPEDELDQFDTAALTMIEKRPATFHNARNIQHIELEALKVSTIAKESSEGQK